MRFLFNLGVNDMRTIDLCNSISAFTKSEIPGMHGTLALRNAQHLLQIAKEQAPLDQFKSQTVALIMLVQLVETSRDIFVDRLEVVEATRRALVSNNIAPIEKAWFIRGRKRLQSLKQLETFIPEASKAFQTNRNSLRGEIRLRLDEFQGAVNQYVSTEFVHDNSIAIWNLKQSMSEELERRVVEFVASTSPSLSDFCDESTARVSQFAGTSIPTPVNMKYCPEIGDFGFVEDPAFEKVMGLNSALRIGDMNMDVIGFGTLGKWLAIAKAPQYVREQHARKNSAQVRNFSRNFAADFNHTVKLNFDRLELYLQSYLDTALKGKRALFGFLQAKPHWISHKPPRLNAERIKATNTMRFEQARLRLQQFRRELNTCYRDLPERFFGRNHAQH